MADPVAAGEGMGEAASAPSSLHGGGAPAAGPVLAEARSGGAAAVVPLRPGAGAAAPDPALSGARYAGYVTVAEAPPPGMITLRCRGDAGPALAALGLPVPGVRRIERAGAAQVAWMAPGEWLLLLPREGVGAALDTLGAALADVPHLAADVSDARAVLRLEGARVREVLAKACPVDIGPMAPGEIRRTRAAQIAAAFWLEEDGSATLICFRSVARYAFELFATLARPGSEVGLFD